MTTPRFCAECKKDTPHTYCIDGPPVWVYTCTTCGAQHTSLPKAVTDYYNDPANAAKPALSVQEPPIDWQTEACLANGALITAERDRERLRNALARAEQRELAALAELNEVRASDAAIRSYATRLEAVIWQAHNNECPTVRDDGECGGCYMSEVLATCPKAPDAP